MSLMNNTNIIHYDGKPVNLYHFSDQHPEFSLFVIKGTWYNAYLYLAVSGDNVEDTDEALSYSYSSDDYDVVDKMDLNLGRVGGLL